MTAGYTDTVCSVKRDYTILDIPRLAPRRDHANMAYGSTIARFRKAKNLTQEELAERIGVSQPTLQRWEKEKREPDFNALEALAEALDVRAADFLLGDEPVPLGPRLYVKGQVAAGQWVEAYEWSYDDWQSFTGRADVTADFQHRFGLRIVGDSMNEIYPDGTTVECVSLFGRAEALSGRRVVIVRRRTSDHLIEATVKELVEIDGRLWARPRSYNPAHQAFPLDEPGPDIDEVRIIAIVVSSIRPED